MPVPALLLGAARLLGGAAARGAASGAARGAASGGARGAAKGAAQGAARGGARSAVRGGSTPGTSRRVYSSAKRSASNSLNTSSPGSNFNSSAGENGRSTQAPSSTYVSSTPRGAPMQGAPTPGFHGTEYSTGSSNFGPSSDPTALAMGQMQNASKEALLPHSKETNTSAGIMSAWKSRPGGPSPTVIGKRTYQSTLGFE